MKDWLKQSYAQKMVAIGLILVGLFVLRHVLNLILLTFIFTYLFYSIYAFVEKRTSIHPKVLIALIYGTFLSLMSIVGYKYAPIIVKEIGAIFVQIANFKISDYEKNLHPKLFEMLSDFNVGHYIRESGNQVLSGVADISSFVFQLAIAIIMSFFFILDKDKIIAFLLKFKNSKVSFLFTHYKEFGQNFLNTFGKVVQVQIIIAGANAILSFIGLWIIGLPQILGLTIMIFFLGLIPVAGVIISIIPLSIIAFQVGGIIKVFHVLLVIAVVHGAENYFLNPKLYSLKMKLPIFFTFAILIISEHIMGVWGLLLGIPLFMFVLDMIKVSTQPLKK